MKTVSYIFGHPDDNDCDDICHTPRTIKYNLYSNNSICLSPILKLIFKFDGIKLIEDAKYFYLFDVMELWF